MLVLHKEGVAYYSRHAGGERFPVNIVTAPSLCESRNLIARTSTDMYYRTNSS